MIVFTKQVEGGSRLLSGLVTAAALARWMGTSTFDSSHWLLLAPRIEKHRGVVRRLGLVTLVELGFDMLMLAMLLSLLLLAE